MWLLALLACKGTNEEEVTFHDDVAPILDQHCMKCHESGGIGPMAFETYDETVTWSEAIVAATQARTMPPKQVVQDGTCGDFVEPWWMSDAELATLANWVAQGTPEGEPRERAERPPRKTIEATHTLQTPEFVPEIVGGELAEFDEYRCFPLSLDGLDSDRFLTGFDVFPGNDAIVHHVIGVIVDPAAQSDNGDLTNAEQMQALDDESPDRLGWPCFTGAGQDVNIESDPIAWAPGQGATEMPEGTGFRVPEGGILVAQVHYNLADPITRGESDSTRVELRLDEQVDKEAYALYLDFLLAFGDSLPAGESAYVYDNSIRTADLGVPVNIDVIGVMPHMHGRGTELTLTVEGQAEDRCLVDVPAWDYGWQFVYFYDQPERVRPNDTVRLSCTFDTMDATEPVKAGWGTQNEMCLAVVYATLGL